MFLLQNGTLQLLYELLTLRTNTTNLNITHKKKFQLKSMHLVRYHLKIHTDTSKASNLCYGPFKNKFTLSMSYINPVCYGEVLQTLSQVLVFCVCVCVCVCT